MDKNTLRYNIKTSVLRIIKNIVLMGFLGLPMLGIAQTTTDTVTIRSINESDRSIISCICVHTCKAIAQTLGGATFTRTNLYTHDDDNYDASGAADKTNGGTIAQALGYMYNGQNLVASDFIAKWYPAITPSWGGNINYPGMPSGGYIGNPGTLKHIPQSQAWLLKYSYFSLGFSMISAGTVNYSGVKVSVKQTIADYLSNVSMLRTYAPFGIFILEPGDSYSVTVDEGFCKNAGYTPNNMVSRGETSTNFYYTYFPFADTISSEVITGDANSDGYSFGASNQVLQVPAVKDTETNANIGWRNLSFSIDGSTKTFIHFGSSLNNQGIVNFTTPITCDSKTTSESVCEYYSDDANFPIKDKFNLLTVASINPSGQANPTTLNSAYLSNFSNKKLLFWDTAPGNFCSRQQHKTYATKACTATDGFYCGSTPGSTSSKFITQKQPLFAQGITYLYGFGVNAYTDLTDAWAGTRDSLAKNKPASLMMASAWASALYPNVGCYTAGGTAKPTSPPDCYSSRNSNKGNEAYSNQPGHPVGVNIYRLVYCIDARVVGSYRDYQLVLGWVFAKMQTNNPGATIPGVAYGLTNNCLSPTNSLALADSFIGHVRANGANIPWRLAAGSQDSADTVAAFQGSANTTAFTLGYGAINNKNHLYFNIKNNYFYCVNCSLYETDSAGMKSIGSSWTENGQTETDTGKFWQYQNIRVKGSDLTQQNSAASSIVFTSTELNVLKGTGRCAYMHSPKLKNQGTMAFDMWNANIFTTKRCMDKKNKWVLGAC